MFPTHFVFNHFPKTGGTSLFAICKYNLPEREISPQLMEEDVRLVRPERFEHYRLVRGHFSMLTQMGFSRHRYSMTMLRNPIQTILSTYNFWRTRPEGDAVTRQAKTLSFAEFVRRFAESPSIIHNPYTHHFAAVTRDYPEEPPEEELLAVAKHNLAAFDFVGICEQFAESTSLLCRETGWKAPPEIPHENRSGRAQPPERLEYETQQMLRQRTRLDLELYEYAVKLFRSRCGGQKLSQTRFSPERNRFMASPRPKAALRRASVQRVTAAQRKATQLLSVTVSYFLAEPIPDLVIAMAIHDAEGRIAYGPITLSGQLTLPFTAGEREVTFPVQGEFTPETYSISAALESADRPGVHYDWVDHTMVFQVAPPPRPAAGVRRMTKRVAKLVFGPFSRPVWTRLQSHLQPVEEKLGLLERTIVGLRDRVIEVGDAVASLREEQRKLRNELRQAQRLCETTPETDKQPQETSDAAPR